MNVGDLRDQHGQSLGGHGNRSLGDLGERRAGPRIHRVHEDVPARQRVLVLLALIAAFALVRGISELLVAIGGQRLVEREISRSLPKHRLQPTS
jgi:hypothetical protein